MSTERPVPLRAARQVVELATRAPSLHNTQPWRWTFDGRSLELWADRRRQLREVDPTGRDLVLSCGAALHQAEVAAEALGWGPTVDRFPDPFAPDLLARVVLTPAAPPPGAAQDLDALLTRCTDRRRFTSWPVPEERLAHLAQVANHHGARAVALTDVTERFHAERLILRAGQEQRAQPAVRLEEDRWRDRPTPDGVPSDVVPAASFPPPAHPARFGGGTLDDTEAREVEGSDGLVVLFDTSDDPHAWLTAGEGLMAMWLTATRGGLSVVPLSQVIELESTRRSLQAEVLGGLAHPLVLARVGWQAIGRSELRRTPRRPVGDVLELV